MLRFTQAEEARDISSKRICSLKYYLHRGTVFEARLNPKKVMTETPAHSSFSKLYLLTKYSATNPKGIENGQCLAK